MNRAVVGGLLSGLFVSFGLLISSAVAIQYQYQFTPDQTSACDQDNGLGENGAAGRMTLLNVNFNSVTNTFVWTATFEPCNGILPNGFWLVINNGPNPKGHSGELAIIYFDGFNPNDPKMTLYAYNGKNSADSYKDGLKRIPGNQAPDRILSSLVSNDWIYEKSITNHPDGTRTLHFSIDASRVINHIPVYPHPEDPWYGMGMDDLIGYWFHPFSGGGAFYCTPNDQNAVCQNEAPGQDSTGFLRVIEWAHHGWYDKGNLETNQYPMCVTRVVGSRPQTYDNLNSDSDAADRALAAIRENTKNDGMPSVEDDGRRCTEVEIGEDVEVRFTGSDPDNSHLKFRYSGLPDGAVMVDSNGTPIRNGAVLDVPAETSMLWTPGAEASGTNSRIQVIYQDAGRAASRCGVRLCVPENNPPICNIQMTTTNPQCGGYESYVEFNGSTSYDPEGRPLLFDWSTTCTNSFGYEETIIHRPQLGGARLVLTQPGNGVNVSCEMKLTISDGYFRSSCSLPVNVQGCQLDCAGIPNGTSTVDQCGVCNGYNACLDCEGTPFGNKVVDQCGVCGGSNACVDCKGQPNGGATVDACGVCGGNGTSCISCDQSDITAAQFGLDGGALAQKNKVFKATKLLGKKDSSPATKAFIKQAREQATQLYVDSWSLTWSLASQQTICTGSVLCATVDNTATVNKYNDNALTLRNLGVEAVMRYREAVGNPKARKKFLKSIHAEYNNVSSASSSIPSASSKCNF